MGQQDYWDARDGAYLYEDCDDFSESATSGEVELPESLPVYLAGIPIAEHGEHLWQEYVFARRRWRNFNNRDTRFERRSSRKGKGKGKGGKNKGKFKGKSPAGM
eukprot:9421263-Heterocapsa_arctica.AAC.1